MWKAPCGRVTSITNSLCPKLSSYFPTHAVFLNERFLVIKDTIIPSSSKLETWDLLPCFPPGSLIKSFFLCTLKSIRAFMLPLHPLSSCPLLWTPSYCFTSTFPTPYTPGAASLLKQTFAYATPLGRCLWLPHQSLKLLSNQNSITASQDWPQLQSCDGWHSCTSEDASFSPWNVLSPWLTPYIFKITLSLLQRLEFSLVLL